MRGADCSLVRDITHLDQSKELVCCDLKPPFRSVVRIASKDSAMVVSRGLGGWTETG